MADRGASPDSAQARRNRWVLFGVLGLGLVPLLGAYWLYQSSRDGAIWGTTNHGELLSQSAQLAQLGAVRLDDAMPLGLVPDGPDAVPQNIPWRVLMVTDTDCQEACDAVLHQVRQMHLLLNKDAHRVKRTLVFIGPLSAGRSVQLAESYPDLELARGHPDPLRPGIFIVDPLGNLVLYYRDDQAGRPVLDDLKRLLKVSQIG